MIDNINPTSQFHPYSAPDVVPARDRAPRSSLNSLNNSFNKQIAKARSVAQKNPGLVLGGLAALAIGAGLLRKRGMAR